MAYALYVVVKLVCYIAWCWLGVWLWQPPSARLTKAIGFGILRLVVGLVFGTLIFFIVRVQPGEVLWKYIAIYSPVRLVEWLILAAIIARGSDKRTARATILWCIGGILVSFGADFASPEGLAGHFCIGRCLC